MQKIFPWKHSRCRQKYDQYFYRYSSYYVSNKNKYKNKNNNNHFPTIFFTPDITSERKKNIYHKSMMKIKIHNNLEFLTNMILTFCSATSLTIRIIQIFRNNNKKILEFIDGKLFHIFMCVCINVSTLYVCVCKYKSMYVRKFCTEYSCK